MVERSAAAPSMILFDAWDLHDQPYVWSGGRHELRVVTEQNRERLEGRLGANEAPLWVVRRKDEPNSSFAALREWVAGRWVTGETSVVEGVTVERYWG